MNTVPQHDREACLREVVGTVSYFQAVGQWPTVTDLWTWMYEPTQDWTLLQVRRAVLQLVERGVLREERGRVQPANASSLVEVTHNHYLDADKKFRQVRRLAYWVGLIPGVRAFCVCNTLAWEATNPDGDTDVFVIARAGTLWWVRLLCVVPLMLFRARPGQRRRHTIDFTFFVADTDLALEHLAHDGQDPYLTYWTRSLIPLVDDGIMDAFWEANTWAAEVLPNAPEAQLAWYRRLPGTHQRMLVRVSALTYRLLRITGALWVGNALAKRLSLWRFPKRIREQMNQSTNVIVNDAMLKFHVVDRRNEILQHKQEIEQRLLAKTRTL